MMHGTMSVKFLQSLSPASY